MADRNQLLPTGTGGVLPVYRDTTIEVPDVKLPTGMALYQAQVEANAETRNTVTGWVWTQVEALIQEFQQWYDDLAVRRLAKRITELVQTGQRTMAASEDAYMSWVIREQSGKNTPSVGQIVVNDLRNGVSLEDVYTRLGKEFRYQQSLGKLWDQALKQTLERAEVMVDTDITLAARAQDQKNLESTSLAVAYRRVIHPELSEGGTCGMCIVASDRVYRKGTLLPIHGRCHCTVAPILKDGTDPGDSLNNLSLADLYHDAGGTQMDELTKTRYKVDEHGELGPILVPVKKTAKSKTRQGKANR